LKELRERLEQVLLDSELEDETGEQVKEYFESLEAELEQAVLSSLDTYQIRTTGIELGQELFDSVHREVLLECGIIEELALECGEVLEDAENPAFALVWYSIFLTYFRHHPEYTGCWEELTDRFDRMLTARQSYEEELDDPILSAEDTEETIELDPPVTD